MTVPRRGVTAAGRVYALRYNELRVFGHRLRAMTRRSKEKWNGSCCRSTRQNFPLSARSRPSASCVGQGAGDRCSDHHDRAAFSFQTSPPPCPTHLARARESMDAWRPRVKNAGPTTSEHWIIRVRRGWLHRSVGPGSSRSAGSQCRCERVLASPQSRWRRRRQGN